MSVTNIRRASRRVSISFLVPSLLQSCLPCVSLEVSHTWMNEWMTRRKRREKNERVVLNQEKQAIQLHRRRCSRLNGNQEKNQPGKETDWEVIELHNKRDGKNKTQENCKQESLEGNKQKRKRQIDCLSRGFKYQYQSNDEKLHLKMKSVVK